MTTAGNGPSPAGLLKKCGTLCNSLAAADEPGIAKSNDTAMPRATLSGLTRKFPEETGKTMSFDFEGR